MAEANDAVSCWATLAPADTLRLAPTLLSGMSFRWARNAETDTYLGVLGTTIYELREDEHTSFYRVQGAGGPPTTGATRQLYRRLRLGEGVRPSYWDGWPRVPKRCREAAAVLPGVRVLRIEPLEALVTFLGSANNNIKRNKLH